MCESNLNKNDKSNINDKLNVRILNSERENIKISPKIDIAFKTLFRNEKKLMINFLNEIFDFKVLDIEFGNKEIIPVEAQNATINNENNKISKKAKADDTNDNKNKNVNEKLGKMYTLSEVKKENFKNVFVKGKFYDISYGQNKDFILTALTDKNKLIKIEIQVNRTGHIFKRSLRYSSGIHFPSLPKGMSYDIIPDVIMINLLDSDLFENNNEKRHWIFEFKERETNKGEGFEHMINIHFIELKKYENLNKKDLKNKYKWIFFLNNPNDDYFRNEETPEIFKEAREKLLTLSKNKKFLALCQQREKDLLDLISTRDEAKAEGIAEARAKGRTESKAKGLVKGRAEGEAKGIAAGKEFKNFEIAINLIKNNVNKDTIERCTGFSKTKIDIIKNFIEAPNDKIEDLKLQLNLNIDLNHLIKIFENCNINIYDREIKKRKTK